MKKFSIRGFALAALLAASAFAAAPVPADYEIREVDGIPYLFMNGIPYFTRFQETDHRILDLAGAWKFKADPEDRGLAEKWFVSELNEVDWKDHPLPGSWQAVFPELVEYLGVGWYRRRFTVPAEFAGKFNRLVLDGAGFHTRVFLNGEEIGRHSGNYTRWSLDVSARLRYGQENLLVLRIDNLLTYSDVPPRLWAGSRLGWWEYAGIGRLVQLESSPAQTVCKLAVTAEPTAEGDGRLSLQGLAYNASEEPARAELVVRLSDLEHDTMLLFPPMGLELPAQDVAAFRLEGILPGVKLWSPDTPGNRYRLTLALSGPAGAERQALEIGFRKFEVQGTQLLLNGKPYYIRGINRHEDDPQTALYQSEARMDEDIAWLKELQVNHLRLAHYPNDPRWLDRMDRAGFTICEEIPLYQAGMGFTKFGEAFFLGAREKEKPPAGVERRSAWSLLHQQADERLIQNAIQQELETIERDRNHPSVVMWSVGNENMTLRFFPSSREMHRRVIAAVRRFDPDRPVTFAVITSIAHLSPRFEGAADLADVISVNEYYGWYYGDMSEAGPYFDRLHRKWPDKPILISEFGADAIPGRHAPAGAVPEKFTEEYQVRMLEQVWSEIAKRDFLVGGMPWVFADFRVGWFGDLHPTYHMNEKGVLTYSREPKAGYEALKKIYADLAAQGR